MLQHQKEQTAQLQLKPQSENGAAHIQLSCSCSAPQSDAEHQSASNTKTLKLIAQRPPRSFRNPLVQLPLTRHVSKNFLPRAQWKFRRTSTSTTMRRKSSVRRTNGAYSWTSPTSGALAQRSPNPLEEKAQYGCKIHANVAIFIAPVHHGTVCFPRVLLMVGSRSGERWRLLKEEEPLKGSL